MKKLLALFLLVVVVAMAALWREPNADTPDGALQASKPDAARQTAMPKSSARNATPTSRAASGATRKLPASFAGTQVDGRLQLDASGNLIIDGEVRRVFDYFLSAIGEEPIDISVSRLRQYIQQQLPPPAANQALGLLSQYLDYKRQLLMLEQNHAQTADLNGMRQRLLAVQQLRAGIFSSHAHQAFFALEEAADSFTLERLAIQRDPHLDTAAKGAAIDRLHSGLPAELLDTLVPQLQSELREQTHTLQVNGGSSTELRQLRQQLVGSAATARLEKLDRQRQEWERKLEAYRAEKIRIENSRGLGDADKRAAIARVAAEHFDETERLRLETAEQLLATENS